MHFALNGSLSVSTEFFLHLLNYSYIKTMKVFIKTK